MSTQFSPFATVIVAGEKIVVTFPPQPHWLLQAGDGAPRTIEPGELLALKAGERITLFERHVRFSATAQLETPAGLRMERTDSIHGSDLTSQFFIPAR